MLFNENERKIWPKWLFRSRFSILGQPPSGTDTDKLFTQSLLLLICNYYRPYALPEKRINLLLNCLRYNPRCKLSFLIEDLAFFQIDCLAQSSLSQTATYF